MHIIRAQHDRALLLWNSQSDSVTDPGSHRPALVTGGSLVYALMSNTDKHSCATGAHEARQGSVFDGDEGMLRLPCFHRKRPPLPRLVHGVSPTCHTSERACFCEPDRTCSSQHAVDDANFALHASL